MAIFYTRDNTLQFKDLYIGALFYDEEMRLYEKVTTYGAKIATNKKAGARVLIFDQFARVLIKETN